MNEPKSAPRNGLLGLLSHEAAGGLLLIAVAALALISQQLAARLALRAASFDAW